jgi:glutamate formiminotransferase/formiminotetrahydrofolate cyclodeaminase
MGAFMNVRINASGYDDKNYVNDILAKGKDIEQKTIAAETAILKVVNEKIGV